MVSYYAGKKTVCHISVVIRIVSTEDWTSNLAPCIGVRTISMPRNVVLHSTDE